MIELGVLLVSIVAGGVAGISGFGIGSLLTPLLAVHYGTKLAVANRGDYARVFADDQCTPECPVQG